jgi:hypothetical protein
MWMVWVRSKSNGMTSAGQPPPATEYGSCVKEGVGTKGRSKEYNGHWVWYFGAPHTSQALRPVTSNESSRSACTPAALDAPQRPFELARQRCSGAVVQRPGWPVLGPKYSAAQCLSKDTWADWRSSNRQVQRLTGIMCMPLPPPPFPLSSGCQRAPVDAAQVGVAAAGTEDK